MSDKQIIIGLTAAKGSGKDLVWNMINNHLNDIQTVKWRRVAFADPIKNKICELFNISKDMLDILKRSKTISISDDEYRYGILSGRDFVRNIGMMMRGYDDQQFNRYVKNQIESHPNTNFVVTDVRFDNEVELVRSLGGVIVKIDRPGYTYDHHITESGTINGDYLINNDGSKEQLWNQVEKVIDEIRHR